MGGLVEAETNFISCHGNGHGVAMGCGLFYGDLFTRDESHFHEFQEEFIFVDAMDHTALTLFEFGQFFLHGISRNGSANLPPSLYTRHSKFDEAMSDIQFFFPTTASSLKNRTALKAFLRGLAKKEGYRIASLNYVFCDDAYLLRINQNFLNHEDLTDIITFHFSESKGVIEGEIYISVPRVKENAGIFNVSITREMHRVIFHGLLHLCGYKDKLKSDTMVMRSKEDHYLDLYFKSL